MKRKLPDLHTTAFHYKNPRRLKHDGGRAWIKNAQLHQAVEGVNIWLINEDTLKQKKRTSHDSPQS